MVALVLTGVIVVDSQGADLPPDPGSQSGFEPFERPGDERLPPPEFPSDRPRDFILPPVKPPAVEEAPLSTQVRVFVRSFRIKGNTVFAPEELQEVVAPFVGRVVTTAELQELRRKLTLLYVEDGYITSGAIIPDQEVTDGTITFEVVEGKLSRIDISGKPRLKADYIRDRIALGDDTPLNMRDLQERLQLLQQDPLIERVNAQLAPGDKSGESVLSVAVEEGRPYQLTLSVNNHRNPSVGSIQGEVSATYRNLTGRGDALNVGYQKTEGLDEWSVASSVPLSASGTTLRVGYRKGDSDVVEEPFNEIDVESKFEETVLSLSHPFIKRINRTFNTTLSLEKRRSKTFLLGRPFSFSPGVDNGKSKVTVIRLIGDWLERRENQVFAIRSTFSKGIKALDATSNSGSPDGQFFAWLGQFQYARRFGRNNNEAILRTDVQLAADPLLPLEKFGVGGALSVRGYRENELVRDNGLVSSLEIRFPILRNVPEIGNLQVAAFADYGRSWNTDGDTPSPKSISSAGLGLRLNPIRGLHAELYGAIPFRNIDRDEHDLQDSGIHFQVSYRLF